MDFAMLPCVTVIVPVHNAEATLHACVDSILAQDYPNLEVLLIENGCTDKSIEICCDYDRRYDFFKLFPSAPKGVAHARNAGLRQAHGFYIMFVDSDDTLSPGAIRTLVENAFCHDLCIAHYNLVLGKQASVRGLVQEDVTMDETAFMNALLKQPGSFYYSALWNKIYRSDIIFENRITFDPFFSWGEDFAFNMQYYKHVEKVRFIPQSVYNYNKTLSGASISTLKRPLHSCKIKYRLYKLLKALCQHKGVYQHNKTKVFRYIGNVTIDQ
ncbi:MAG: glycosyltransferase [Clostridiales bacterium]|nr:glycosyltransferase [Clostridiales bacterium]